MWQDMGGSRIDLGQTGVANRPRVSLDPHVRLTIQLLQEEVDIFLRQRQLDLLVTLVSHRHHRRPHWQVLALQNLQIASNHAS